MRQRERLERIALPLATLAFFLATARGYGIFRDELYYLACGQHLDWGYVDHPPLVAVLAAAARALIGESLLGLRAFPALAAAGTVLLIGDTTRALGGGRFARLMAQVLAATAPIYLSLFSIFSMNAFGVLVWAGLARLAVGLLAGTDPRRWLAFGLLAGVGLLNKVDVGMLGVGLAAGLVVARRWDLLRSPWPWLGAVLAAGLIVPHIVWQQAHGWPTREFIASAQQDKIARLSPAGFLVAQLQLVGPLACALSAAGVAWLLFGRGARAFRPLGWAALTVLAILLSTISKPYYLAPALALMFPAAGVALEVGTARRFTRPARALAVAGVVSILFAAPLVKPLLDEEAYVRYAAALGTKPGSDENHELGRLPQFFADMHGWHELTQAVARVHAALPAQDRERACIFAQNYGQAGAIDFFGPALGLPRAICGHNSYWMWGPGTCTGEVIVVIGGQRDALARNFTSLEAAGEYTCADCMPYESNLTIWVARGLRAPIQAAWAGVRHYD
jgi:hypothetical protein